MLQVVAALIRKNDHFLLCQRPPGKARSLKWEFPGGKIEPRETPCEALVREIQEELGITVETEKEVASMNWTYPDISIHLSLYLCHMVSSGFTLREHSACAWVTGEEAREYDLAAADRALLEQLSF